MIILGLGFQSLWMSCHRFEPQLVLLYKAAKPNLCTGPNNCRNQFIISLIYRFRNSWQMHSIEYERTMRAIHGPLTRYVKLLVVLVPGMPGTVSPPPTSKETASWRSRHASRHVGVANLRWRGKRPRHSRPMHNPQFYVSGKRPMVTWGNAICVTGPLWGKLPVTVRFPLKRARHTDIYDFSLCVVSLMKLRHHDICETSMQRRLVIFIIKVRDNLIFWSSGDCSYCVCC